jgi:hypothetical protein
MKNMKLPSFKECLNLHKLFERLNKFWGLESLQVKTRREGSNEKASSECMKNCFILCGIEIESSLHEKTLLSLLFEIQKNHEIV